MEGRRRDKWAQAKALDREMPALMRKLGAGGGFSLVRLWRAWPQVVGEHIAEVARPLGHRKTTLIIGADDSMVAQELTYYAPQIIEDVNAFLGKETFDKVQVELVMGKAPLDTVSLAKPVMPETNPGRPEKLGGLAGRLDPQSPVARCYEAYIRMMRG
ncbi:MAG: DUF721 domain-containing protein [Desulfovibrionaceae bacterium]